MSSAYPRIRRHEQGPAGDVLVRREVIQLVLYLPLNHHALALPIQRALDMYLDAVGTGPEIFSEYSLGYESAVLHEDSWSNIRQILSTSDEEYFLDDEEDEQLRLMQQKNQCDRMVELSSEERGVTGFGFFYWARLSWRVPPKNQMSLVSFSWPTEYLEACGPGRMREEMMALAALLPYASGHAGLAFSSPNLWGPSMKDIHEDALRYPGLDVTHGQREMGTRVDGVHWLNFLGPEVSSHVGGAEVLRSRLHSPSSTVQSLVDGRVLVSLGLGPEAGDLRRGDTLPAYRELARVLEPWLFSFPEHMSWRDCPLDAAHRWWRRFLDE
ncbi:hypothetical protein CYFUS_002305 [Cystobacter fuscus]|uniref:DUF3396 domain-containing protein n=1 Tax=Cystobacter fuscus TaxID=43 RepID=A0A250J037_9BACT|nr:type VI immunity family protein [Cystobacter fuscus]ATB36890.1 hypothetical protein CYFUS_002305 [Cystobacter fuscus]